MDYIEFLQQQNILSKLLAKLGILVNRELIIRINNYPDYNISEYRREEDSDYYFKSLWNFGHVFPSAVDIRFLQTRLFHHDDLVRASTEFRMPFDMRDYEKCLNDIHSIDESWFSQSGFDTDIDQFKLRELRKASIDDTKKILHYEGSFFGNHETFDPVDWGVFSLIEITGLTDGGKKFYKDLIRESYVLERENRNKLSYFLAYSAFESFVNFESGTSDDEERLKDKLKRLFRTKFPKLDKNKIYCAVINDFGKFTVNRNNIAHGSNDIQIGNEELNKLLLFILIMITCYEYGCNDFDELI